MIWHKRLKEIEVFGSESDHDCYTLTIDVGKLRLTSGYFLEKLDVVEAAHLVDEVISRCLDEGVFEDLRGEEKT